MALFLTELGLPLRAATLWKAAPQPERDAIEAATHRLLHPNAMGRHFQVVAWASDNVPPPAGFDHANARH
jgi:SAM-dependent MidA family methyltransferase